MEKINEIIKKLNGQNFSFDETMKIFDLGNYIYLDVIDKFEYNCITNYDKSKYIFKEITNEFKTTYELLISGKILMSVCLLRNIFEDIMYIMATSLGIELDISVQTRAHYFYKIVEKNCSILLSDAFNPNDIPEIYQYLSKITHVTNLKESTSYLIENDKNKVYIINIIKYMILFIEYLYIDFLNKKCKKDSKLCDNILTISSYILPVNLMYFSLNNYNNNDNILKLYFYGEQNRMYLDEEKDKIINGLNDINDSKEYIDQKIVEKSIELDKQLKEYNYMDAVNRIFN